MSEGSPLVPLKEALRRVLGWLDSEGVKGVVIGGVAASLLGRPRATRDVDLVVWLEDSALEAFVQSAGKHGFEPRMDDVLSFARQSRVLLVRHSDSAIDVDIALGTLPFEKRAIERRQQCVLGDLTVPLPRAEDLIIMKAVAHRPRDTADVEALLEANVDVDREYVRRVVGEFASALDTPDLLSDLESVLSRIPPES